MSVLADKAAVGRMSGIDKKVYFGFELCKLQYACDKLEQRQCGGNFNAMYV